MKYTVFVKFDRDDKIEIKENEITISLKSEPERGRANRELIQRLAGHFRVSGDKKHIITGLNSTKKLVEVSS
jgi:uncharacterized protein YggU (UPF0235/DUF167 family)